MLYTDEHCLKARLEELKGKLLADIGRSIPDADNGSADKAASERSIRHTIYKVELYQLFNRMTLELLVRLERHELSKHHLSALMAMENVTLVETIIEGGEQIVKAAFQNPTDKAIRDFLYDIAEEGALTHDQTCC